jgi:hypothetical protein
MLRVMQAPAAMTMVGDDSMASMPKERISFLCNVVIALERPQWIKGHLEN